MNKLIYLGFAFFVMVFINQRSAIAQTIISIDTEAVVVCPAKPNQITLPTFTEFDCEQDSLFNVDPQNNEVWIKANLTVTEAYLKRQQPSALFVFGKMSSEVYLNGQWLGNNGTPSFLPAEEFSGDMDARFYIPPNVIKQGENEVIIHASSHHGFLLLENPIHFIGVSEYTQTGEYFKRDLLISVSLLGSMLLGCIYLITLAFKSEDKITTMLALLMLTSASVQLFLEVSRVLFNYSYPFHDIRLIAIVVLSLIFGFSFLLLSLYKFKAANKKRWLTIAIPLTLVVVIVTTGFDGKSAMAILLPALISAMLTAYNYNHVKTRESLAYLIAYTLFVLTILSTFGSFNSMYFYYIVTGMMAFLIIKETTAFAYEKKRRRADEQQVIKLQLKLDQIAQKISPTKLQLNVAGKIEFIPVHDISYCKAAGDYVEIFMTDKRQSLFSGTLKSIEEQLPENFMKVHRSFIVNLEEVTSIAASSAGKSSSGTLVLTTGDEVPVSRRILPQVKGMIKGNIALR